MLLVAGVASAGSAIFAVPACAGTAVAMPAAAVYGDGEPGNGPEDSRVPFASADWDALALSAWSLSGGTLHCDGRLRGSAVILEVRELAARVPPGLVLMTAAHNLFDLESGRRFQRCQFHYMGLAQLPGYQGEVALETVRAGAFDPAAAADEAGFGRDDWAFLHIPGGLSGVFPGAGLRPYPFEQLRHAGPEAMRFRLLAWDGDARAVSLSLDCRVVESRPGDLGGGAWRGQLLDDCDSGQGASGGGLVATRGGEHVLVGIRTGAHWSAPGTPGAGFADSPLPGAVWDVERSTNFCRAVDQALLLELRRFLLSLVEA